MAPVKNKPKRKVKKPETEYIQDCKMPWTHMSEKRENDRKKELNRERVKKSRAKKAKDEKKNAAKKSKKKGSDKGKVKIK